MMGKHSQEALKIKQLEETIELKKKEIKDIKFSVSDVLLQIRNINSKCKKEKNIRAMYRHKI